jgi:hypothetical protein
VLIRDSGLDIRESSEPLLLEPHCFRIATPEPRVRGCYFVSLCDVCFRQNRQYLLISSRSVVFFLFLVVL